MTNKMNKYRRNKDMYEQVPGSRGGMPIKKHIAGNILEQYFGLGRSITEIAKTSGVSHNTICRYTSKSLQLKASESTITLTLKSKV